MKKNKTFPRTIYSFTLSQLCNILLPMVLTTGCAQSQFNPHASQNLNTPLEKNFKKLRQVTFNGGNISPHWSFRGDGRWLTFQHKNPRLQAPSCYQTYKTKNDGTEIQMLSNGEGETASSFFFPDDKKILYSSTHAAHRDCPVEPKLLKIAPFSKLKEENLWPIIPSYQIYSVKNDGTDLLQVEPGGPNGYNSETTLCHDGTAIFTSDRKGNLDLYRAEIDSFGSFQNIKQLTHTNGTFGYNGGASFSPDCKKITWHASLPQTDSDILKYRSLLQQHFVDPSSLEIWMADSDGSHAHAVTHLEAESKNPTFSPDGTRILFSSNFDGNFNIYSIQIQGTHLEKMTDAGTINDSPMFSPDGDSLLFTSNRGSLNKSDTNIFIADWTEKNEEKVALTDDNSPANRVMALIEELSLPSREGRGLGTAGLKLAEDRIAERFEKLGLKTLFEFSNYKMSVETKNAVTNNVIGTWGNTCPQKNPMIIGAHLDHLGFGGEGSLEPSQKGIHPGADDNASGVAALIEVARKITLNPQSQKHCFIFVAFTGEEIGIAGSSRFMELLKKKSIHPKAMLNMDMVGRLENNHLISFGSDSALEWNSILFSECQSRGLTCAGGGDGYGPSDHMPFYIAKVPVVHFFTGPHLDYHRTTDTAEKINATGIVQIADAVAAISIHAALKTPYFHYQKAAATPTMGAISTSTGQSHGAYLGTIPDYSTLASPHGHGGAGEPTGGVKLAGTRPGSPADRAGIQAGDTLKVLHGQKVKTLQDFTLILTTLKPGDEVEIEIERNGKAMSLHATIGKRQ